MDTNMNILHRPEDHNTGGLTPTQQIYLEESMRHYHSLMERLAKL